MRMRGDAKAEAPPPIISVLLPVYNGQRFLSRALNSIRNQTFRNFEVVVVDDASTDHTPRLLDLQADLPLVLLRNKTRLGVTRSLRRAAEQARGEILVRHDADDLSHPRRFREQLDILKKFRNIVFVGTDYEVIDENGIRISVEKPPRRPGEIAETLRWRNVFAHGGVAIRRSAYERIGGYDPSISYSQDFDLYRKLISIGRCHVIPKILYSWRKHSSSVNSVHRDLQSAYLSYILAGKPPNRRQFIRSVRASWRRHFRGVDQIHAGNNARAMEELQAARTLDPGNIWTTYHLSSLWQRQGWYAEATSAFRRIARNGPADLKAGAFYHLGEIFLKQDRWADGRKYLESCLDLIPGHRMARKMLNDALADGHK